MLRNVIFIVLLFLTAPSIVGAQEQQARNAGDPLIPTCAFPAALCGYVDRAGRTVIDPRFDWADRFFEDRAAVRLAGKYGFIDRAGTIVVPLAYDLVGNFSNGRAEVLNGNKVGLIDASGGSVIAPQFGRIFQLPQDHFLVSVSAHQQVHVSPFEHFADRREAAGTLRGRWGVIDLSQRWIIEPKFQEIQFFTYEGGDLFWARSGDRWQLMRADGQAVTEAIFDHVQVLLDNRAIVGVGGKRGAVDGQGRMAIDARFEHLAYFEDGLALFRENAKYGMVDRNGAVVIPPIYERLGRFDRSGTVEATRGGVTVWLDRSGQAVDRSPSQPSQTPASPAQGDTRLCGDGAFAASEGGKWGFTDTDGKFFIAPRYDRVGCFHRGLAWAAIPERREWCLIDTRGDIADRPCHCEQPLVIIEHWAPRPSISPGACYQAGLDLLGPLRGRSR